MVNFLENSDLEAAKYVIGQPYVYVVRVRARVCVCVRRVGVGVVGKLRGCGLTLC